MRYLTIFLLLLLCACSPLKKFDSTGHKWETSIKQLEDLNETENYSEQAVLFIGSSSIRRWDSIKKDLDPYEPIKRGYGGAHFYDLIHFTKRLVSPHKVKAIAVFVANDITGNQGGINDLSPKEVLSLVKIVTKQIRKTHNKTPIFFIETTPSSSRWKVWNKISKANDLIKDFTSKKRNIFFIDTRSYFLKLNGMPNDEFFVGDKLHLNNRGYKLWSKIITESFDKNLISKI